jgi:hypothetical protein
MASTGHDVRGESFPSIFRLALHRDFQPAIIYLTALVLKLCPCRNRQSAPIVGLAVLDIVLITLWRGSCSRRTVRHRRRRPAGVDAGPLHPRAGMDYLGPCRYSRQFLCLIQARDVAALAADSGSSFSAWFLFYIASIVTMPPYLRPLIAASIAMIAVRLCGLRLCPLAHPVCRVARRASARLRRDRGERLYDAHQLDAAGVSVALELRERQRTGVKILELFNPAFLLFGSGIKMPFSTNSAFSVLVRGVVAAGIYVGGDQTAASLIYLAVVAGFAAAPLAAVVVANRTPSFAPGDLAVWRVARDHRCALPVVRSDLQMLRWPYPMVSLAIVLAGAGYALWTLATQSRDGSALPLMALGVAIFAAGLVLDRLNWRIVAVCLVR